MELQLAQKIDLNQLVMPFQDIVHKCHQLYNDAIALFVQNQEKYDFQDFENYNPEIEKILKDLYLAEKSYMEQIYELRKPFTDQIVLIQKVFTTAENHLKNNYLAINDTTKKTGFLMDYQKYKAKKQAEEQAKIQKAKDKEIEKTQIVADYKIAFEKSYSDFVVLVKNTILTRYYNVLNSSNYDELYNKFINLQIGYEFPQTINKFSFVKSYIYNSQQEVDAIYKTIDLREIAYSKEIQFISNIKIFIIETTDKIVARKNELIREAKIKDEAEKKKIADAKSKLEQAEKEKIVKEQAIEQAKATTEIETIKQVQVLEQEIMSEINTISEEPEAFEYQIETSSLSPSGFLTIFMYWYENVGKKLDNDKLQKEFDKQVKFLQKAINDGAKFENPMVKVNKIAVSKSIRKTSKY